MRIQDLIKIFPSTTFGRYVLFCRDSFQQIPDLNKRRALVLQQMEFVGVKSIGVIILAAFMIGAVFGIQFGTIFKLFGTESMIGAAAAFAIFKELAPVVGSFLVTGRAGSAMAAEIGMMRVNEQIDAMRVMAVDPVGYLVSPRLLAAMLMMPLLAAIFMVCGIFSTYVIAVQLFQVDTGIFVENIRFITKPRHIFEGLQKAVIFGAIFATISCFMGFNAKGGAKGVGRSTTRAVVISLVTILIADFFISYAQFRAARSGF